MSLVWSFSGLKTFQQCPRKYYHLKVAQDVVDRPHEAALYGSAVHKAAEEYVRDGVPIPKKFGYMQPILDNLMQIPGERLCELELGITQALEPCAFKAPDVWWHGIVDLLIVDEESGVAHMVDYKTSKSARYADTKQLDLMAIGVFAKYPKINKIKSALLFVVSNDIVKKVHDREALEQYIAPVRVDLARLNKAMETEVWNTVTGPLCRFCPVRMCEYNRS